MIESCLRTGKVAVVTGAASGIGLALARRLASEGMSVVLADLNQEGLERETSRLRDQGHHVTPVQTDVANLESVQNLAGQCLRLFGKVHLLCNNAGVVQHTGQAVWEVSPQSWDWLVGVNLRGVVHGLHAFLPPMLAHGESAHVVNTASMAGLLAGCGAYGMTKHAVVSLSESLLFDLRQRGSRIGVSCLCPGLVNTSIAQRHPKRPESAAEKEYRERIERVTRERGLAPESVADAVVEGIREGSFYLLPGCGEPEREGLRERHKAILEGRQPPAPPLPSGC